MQGPVIAGLVVLGGIIAISGAGAMQGLMHSDATQSATTHAVSVLERTSKAYVTYSLNNGRDPARLVDMQTTYTIPQSFTKAYGVPGLLYAVGDEGLALNPKACTPPKASPACGAWLVLPHVPLSVAQGLRREIDGEVLPLQADDRGGSLRVVLRRQGSGKAGHMVLYRLGMMRQVNYGYAGS